MPSWCRSYGRLVAVVRTSFSGECRWTQDASRLLAEQDRDWDLWGPLVICLSLAIILSVDVGDLTLLHWVQLTQQAPKEQAMQVFSLVISLIAIGSVVVTINSKLLGGKV